MLISETTKMTSSAKPRNHCQSNPAEDYSNYSTLIPTGWNYNIPPKYMIYECTLAVRNLSNVGAAIYIYCNNFAFCAWNSSSVRIPASLS